MKRNLLFVIIFLVFAAANVYAQPNIFNHNDPLVNYNPASPPATPPANTMAKWVKTTTRISWNTGDFKAYYWNGMAFRLRFPNNYNPADNTKKYPVILFFHGAGETGPVTDNEDQLYWGAQPFEQKIDAGQFNAFMLFPQVSGTSWDWFYQVKINNVLDSLEKYCHTDPDRVISMGLSNGAYASMFYAYNFPTRAATVIASSPALVELLQETQNSTVHIPHWLGSGGTDISPGPVTMNNFANAFKAKGGDLRYSFFPEWGHNIWGLQWEEPYLLPYWTSAHKANPLIFYQKSQYCPGAVNVRLGISAGFAEYQWQLNNVDIAGSNTNEITGTQLGTYRARFRRIPGGVWSDWSPVPAVISALPLSTTPPIKVTGTKSTVLPAPDGSTTTPLELPAGFTTYEWRRISDNALMSSQRTFDAPVGQYKGKATNCEGNYSPTFTITSANGSPVPDSARNVTLTRVSATSIRLNWIDVTTPVTNETGFEIYRAPAAGGPYTLATITAANIRTYTDTSLNNNYNYYYVIRAVNANGAAKLSRETSLQPVTDIVAPSVPANLRAAFTSRTFIDLEWDASTDNVGVTAYDVYINNVIQYTTIVPKVTAINLVPRTSYAVKIVARDQAGNSSAATNVLTTMSIANGLKYRVYQGAWDVLPNFNTLTPVASGSSPNVNILVRPAGLNDNFGFVWEGYINIPVAGTYTFETVSDDGSKAYINTFYDPAAPALVNNDGLHAAVPVTGSVTINDIGMHAISFTFFDKTGGESMQVYWSGPGIPRQLIPNMAFTEGATNQAPVANAGPDKSITLPVSSTTLDGSGTDGDGTISSYAWSQLSGPNTATFSSTTVAAPTVSGLVAGSYVFSFIVTDNQSAPSAADQVLVNVTAGSGSTPVYRINSGGEQVTNSIGVFGADAFFSPFPGNVASTSADITGTNDDAMYQSVRYGATGTLNYAFPIANGQYTVILHFAEMYFNNLNNRVFDVTLENTKMLDNYDIFRKAGANAATTESSTVSVTDGVLNIYFSSLPADGGVNNPMVSAIEIIRTSSNASPVANAGPDKTITLPASTTTLDGAGTDADGTINSYVWSQVSGPNTATFSSKVVPVPSLSGLVAGTYVFSLVVTDNQFAASLADQVTVTVNPAGGGIVYRINSGGVQVTNSIGVFAADAFYSPTPGNIASTTAGINGTLDDDMYQTVRYGATGTLNYAFPVTNGQYTVILHFAEMYFSNANSRIFDVTLESSKILDNYDIFKKAGANTATTETATVSVTDGTLNLYFSSLAADGGTNSPMVSAIEIIKISDLGTMGADGGIVTLRTTTNETVSALTSLNGTDAGVANAGITRAYPNPFKDNLKIQFSSPTAASKVTVGIYDLAGRTVQTQYFGNTTAGVNTLSINLSNQMMPGMYVVRLDVDGKSVKMWKMVKQKK